MHLNSIFMPVKFGLWRSVSYCWTNLIHLLWKLRFIHSVGVAALSRYLFIIKQILVTIVILESKYSRIFIRSLCNRFLKAIVSENCVQQFISYSQYCYAIFDSCTVVRDKQINKRQPPLCILKLLKVRQGLGAKPPKMLNHQGTKTKTDSRTIVIWF